MSVSFRACLAVLLFALFADARAAQAQGAPAVPSEDRGILAGLAPPSGGATARGTYGDAVFARPSPPRSVTRLAKRGRCFAGQPGTVYMRCSESGSVFFRRNYVFTPSYVSAPQALAPAPSGRTNLLSPFTSFFLDPFDPHDQPDGRRAADAP